jgi:GTP-binding protein Era
VSIVSPVAQTTRHAIRGILTEPRGQIVFVDTPGVHRAQSDLGKLMNRMARASVEGADVVLLALDPTEPPRQEDAGWVARLQREETPVVCVLNKSDLPADRVEDMRALWAAAPRPPVWRPASALTGAGVPELVTCLMDMLPEGPPLFPEDVLTDYPRKLNIADVIREKLFGVLREDLPHSVAVWIETIEEGDNEWNVEAVIYVNKSSQKGIVIGERGRLLRRVKRAAEAELTEMYGRSVRVRPWVKVEPNWTRNFWLLKKFGYAS